MKHPVIIILFVLTITNCFSQSNEVIHVWAGKVPDEDSLKHPARLYHDTSRSVIRITDITDPIITVYLPNDSKKRMQE